MARRMHQTTVRFGSDLWAALEHECAGLGVSAAQYVREATLARLTYNAGRAGDREYDLALLQASADMPVAVLTEPGGGAPGSAADITQQTAPDAPDESELDAKREAFAALRAQSRLAHERSRELREQARSVQRRYLELGR